MRVAEHFYSIQGEGVSAGMPAVFLRLSGCNLLCGGQGTIEDKKLHDGATWRCDTIEVWMKGNKKSPEDLMHVFEQHDYLKHLAAGAHLIITGGEPLQQHEEVCEFILLLAKTLGDRPYVEIETNGTLMPTELLVALVDQWNVSPKLANSGMPFERRIKKDVLRRLGRTGNAWCKLVVWDERDLKEFDGTSDDPTTYFRSDEIILMPAASDRETLRILLPTLAELCKKKHYRLSTRMQVEIWDKTTGV